MNRPEKEKEIAGIIGADKEAMQKGRGKAREEIAEQILALFPEYKVKVDCAECGGASGMNDCKSCGVNINSRRCNMVYNAKNCLKIKCSLNCKDGKVLTDLADGVTGEIVKIK